MKEGRTADRFKKPTDILVANFFNESLKGKWNDEAFKAGKAEKAARAESSYPSKSVTVGGANLKQMFWKIEPRWRDKNYTVAKKELS